MLLRNVLPGSYRVLLSAGWEETLTRGDTAVEVRDRSVEATVALRRGLDIEGKIILADGVEQTDLSGLEVVLLARDGYPQSGSLKIVDADGRFHARNQPPGFQTVSMTGGDYRFYAREVRYSGIAQPFQGFTLDEGSQTRLLEVVIDDKPGGIAGVVEDLDKPVSKPWVIAVKWPPPERVTLAERPAMGDDTGKFTIPLLAPGEYRVVAVAGELRDMLNDRGVLDRVLASAEKVTVDRGGVANIRIKLTDPRR